MNLKNKFAVLAGSALIVGGLLTGAAFAASPATPEAAAERAAKIEQAVADGKISQNVADLMLQLGNLRQAAMEKLNADSKALVDQAVAAGTITQEEADQLLSHKGRGGHFGGGFKGMTQEELQAKLAEKVAAGEITQEQADMILSGEARLEKGGKGGKGGHGGKRGGGFMGEKAPKATN